MSFYPSRPKAGEPLVEIGFSFGHAYHALRDQANAALMFQ